MRRIALLVLALAIRLTFAQAPPQIPLTGNIGVPGSVAVLGGVTITLPDTNYTLTPGQWANKTLVLTGTLTAGRNVVLPLNKGQEYNVSNQTGQTITLVGATGTGVAVAAAANVSVFTDGVNYLTGAAGGNGTVSGTQNTLGRFTTPDGKTITASTATVDSGGNNYSFPAVGGKSYASRWQTGGGSNGFANLINSNCTNSLFMSCDAIMESGYSPNDPMGNLQNYSYHATQLPGYQGALTVQDLRTASPAWYMLNPGIGNQYRQAGPQFSTYRTHAPLSSSTTYAAGSYAALITDVMYGGGYSLNNAGQQKYNFGGLRISLDSRTPVQQGGILDLESFSHSGKDQQGLSYNFLTAGCLGRANRLTNAGTADECSSMARGHIVQNKTINLPTVGAIATQSDGTVLLTSSYENNNSTGVGRLVVDQNPSTLIYNGTLGGGNIPTSGQYFYQTSSQIFALTNNVPSAWSSLGTSAWTLTTQEVTPNPLTGPVPATGVSFTVANGAACAAGSPIVIGGFADFQYTQLTAVSGNTWTISTLQSAFPNGTAVACGGPVGQVMWQPLTTYEPVPGMPLHSMMIVMGYDGTNLYVDKLSGENLYASSNTPNAPTFTVTTSGGAVTGITHTGTQPMSYYPATPPKLVVAGCTVAPVAHVVMTTPGILPANGTDAVDSPGSGCTSPTATAVWVYTPPVITPTMNAGGTALASLAVGTAGELGNVDTPPFMVLYGAACTQQPRGHLNLGYNGNIAYVASASVDFAGVCPASSTVTATIADGRPTGASSFMPTTYVMAPATQITSVMNAATGASEFRLAPSAGLTSFAVNDPLEVPNVPGVNINVDVTRTIELYNAENTNGVLSGYHLVGPGGNVAGWAHGIINNYTRYGSAFLPFSKKQVGQGLTHYNDNWIGGYSLGGTFAHGLVMNNPPQRSFTGAPPGIAQVICNAVFTADGSTNVPCSDPNYDLTAEQPFDGWGVYPADQTKGTHDLVSQATHSLTHVVYGTTISTVSGDTGVEDFKFMPTLNGAAFPTGSSSTQTINALDHGVACDGTTVDTTAIQTLLAAYPNSEIVFPKGTTGSTSCLLNNSGGTSSSGLTVPSSFHGKLHFIPGVALTCNTSTATAGQCVTFSGNSNIQVDGMTISYTSTSGLPLARNASSPDNSLFVQNSTDVSFSNTTVIASPGVGIWNTGSSRIRYLNTTITNTSADGWHAENCQDCGVDGIWTTNTGDDAIAFTNIASSSPNTGGYAFNSHIRTSHTRGIVTPGQSYVNASGFDIQGTAYSCIAAAQDTSISSNTPTNVKFSNGSCSNNGNGTVTPAAGTTGNQYGIDIGLSSYVTVSNVKVQNTGNDGLYIYSNAAHANVSDVEIVSAGNVGAQTNSTTYTNLTNIRVSSSVGSDYSLTSCVHCVFTGISSDTAGAYGVYASGLNDAQFNNVKIRNAAGTNGGLAWEIESAAGAINTYGLTVVDDKGTAATGYKIGDYNNGAFANNVYGFQSQITNGTFAVAANGGTGTNNIYYPANLANNTNPLAASSLTINSGTNGLLDFYSPCVAPAARTLPYRDYIGCITNPWTHTVAPAVPGVLSSVTRDPTGQDGYSPLAAANGTATLDSNARLYTAQLPALGGDVTSSAGSNAVTVSKINGSAFPVISPTMGGPLTSNANGQPIGLRRFAQVFVAGNSYDRGTGTYGYSNSYMNKLAQSTPAPIVNQSIFGAFTPGYVLQTVNNFVMDPLYPNMLYVGGQHNDASQDTCSTPGTGTCAIQFTQSLQAVYDRAIPWKYRIMASQGTLAGGMTALTGGVLALPTIPYGTVGTAVSSSTSGANVTITANTGTAVSVIHIQPIMVNASTANATILVDGTAITDPCSGTTAVQVAPCQAFQNGQTLGLYSIRVPVTPAASHTIKYTLNSASLAGLESVSWVVPGDPSNAVIEQMLTNTAYTNYAIYNTLATSVATQFATDGLTVKTIDPVNGVPVTFVGSITSGSNVLTYTGNAGLLYGLPVSGTGIPAGTTVTGMGANNTVTMSANATATAANSTFTVTYLIAALDVAQTPNTYCTVAANTNHPNSCGEEHYNDLILASQVANGVVFSSPNLENTNGNNNTLFFDQSIIQKTSIGSIPAASILSFTTGGGVAHITGTTAINTMLPDPRCVQQYNACFRTLIFDTVGAAVVASGSTYGFNTGANITSAGTAITWVYEYSQLKWYTVAPYSVPPVTIASSATPAISVNLPLVNYVLTAATTPTTTGTVVIGSQQKFHLCENATGGFAYTWPAIYLNPPTVNTTASTCTDVTFTSWDGARFSPDGPGITGVTP